MSILDLLRPELRGLAGYSSARMEAGRANIMLDANESPWPATGDSTAGLNRYPEPQPALLRARLATLYGVPEQNLLLARGSDEAIDLLTRAFCRAGRDAVLVAPPTFGMYAACAAVQGAAVVSVPPEGAEFAFPFEAAAEAATDTVKLVFVCSPNNPTGGIAPAGEVLALAQRLDGRALVVVDEAYVEFAACASLAVEASKRPNLAVLRTLSKAHALAGARVGALVCDAGLVSVLRRLMAPYPLPAPCVRLAEAALEPEALAATRARVALLQAERARLAAALARAPGAGEVLPSHGNFLAVRFDDAATTYARLAACGIVVRDVSRQPCLAGFLRISVGTPAENDALLRALGARRAAA